MSSKKTIPFLAALLFLLPVSARAEAPPTVRDITSVRAAGMGGAALGFASGDEAVLINPAAIAATVRFNLAASAVFDPPHDFRVLGISSVDSQLNAEEAFAFSGAVGYYNYASGEGDARRTGSVVAVGMAAPLYPDVLFVGVTGKFLGLKGAVESSAITLDAAAMLKVGQYVGLSGVGYNLIDIANPEAQRSWGFGAAIGTDTQFHVDFDVRLDPNPSDELVATYRAGAELVVAGMVLPRAGFSYDGLREVRQLSGGVSVILEGLAIEAAYQHALNGAGRSFGVSLRLLRSPFAGL